MGEMTERERRKLYRRQVTAAWRDGAMDPSERRPLYKLRDALALSNKEAARIVSAAVREGA